MSVARPPDFEPLASGNPVPGDPDEIAMLGRRYADTAAEIARQAANLRKLATAAPGGWKGQAGTVFHSHAADLATRISKAHDRYAATGEALSHCAGPMQDAQQRAYAAVWQAKSAQQQMTANAPGPPRPPGSPPLTDAQKAQQRTQQAAYDDAQSSLVQATRNFDDAVSDYRSAANRAARQIGSAISHDGLKDSWWDRNFGWISTVFKVVAIVVLVVAVVALLLMMPWSAALIAAFLGLFGAEVSVAALGTAAGYIGWALFGVTAVQAAFDGTAAATGKESWLSFGLDIFAMATFGFGKAAEAGVKILAEGAADSGAAVAAGRAGRAAMSSRGLPGILYSIGSRSGLAAKAVRLLGVGGQLDESMQAAAGARSALVTAVKAAEPGNAVTAWAMSDGLAGNIARLNTISEQVPGVLRVEVPKAVAYGLMAADGAGQWTSFGLSNGNSVVSMAAGDPVPAEISQTIAQFRQMLSRVP
ncbi:MAG TPA: WXG100 family type VII secretion target [Streptosporangiaceae bacterium]|nr:WXG100 family type VII secretion target [Streptosporangiaceae bacterium]